MNTRLSTIAEKNSLIETQFVCWLKFSNIYLISFPRSLSLSVNTFIKTQVYIRIKMTISAKKKNFLIIKITSKNKMIYEKTCRTEIKFPIKKINTAVSPCNYLKTGTRLLF